MRIREHRGGSNASLRDGHGVGTVKHVLAIQFVDEDKDIVHSYGQDEERNDFRYDECRFDSKKGEESYR